VLEGRFASLRTQATALLAVDAVILGIGAGAIGGLASRELSPATTALSIAGIFLSLIALIGSGILLVSSLRVSPGTRYSTGLATTVEEAEGGNLEELDLYARGLEKGFQDVRTYLQGAAIALGIGVALGVAVAAILFFVKSQPTQTRVVRGSTVTVQTSP
jgi:hypothetical protein